MVDVKLKVEVDTGDFCWKNERLGLFEASSDFCDKLGAADELTFSVVLLVGVVSPDKLKVTRLTGVLVSLDLPIIGFIAEVAIGEVLTFVVEVEEFSDVSTG